jgi:hypothetical protein
MRDVRETDADAFFRCSDSERAAFEAGIKFGTIYHQFVGVPLSAESADTLERAIEAGCRVQPFVEDVKVRIDRSMLKRKRGQFDYTSLTGEMLDVTLVVRYKSARVEAGMRFVREMNYPLMFIKEIRKD